MAIEMNRKILTRVSALLCAVILGIPNISNGINANAEDMDSYGAVYADDGHKIVNLDIAGNHYPDAYNYLKEHNENYTNPQWPSVSIEHKDKTYNDFYKKYYKGEHLCTQYVVCRVHELTGIWISNQDSTNWCRDLTGFYTKKIRP